MLLEEEFTDEVLEWVEYIESIQAVEEHKLKSTDRFVATHSFNSFHAPAAATAATATAATAAAGGALTGISISPIIPILAGVAALTALIFVVFREPSEVETEYKEVETKDKKEVRMSLAVAEKELFESTIKPAAARTLKKIIRDRLCPLLKGLSGDAFEIAKVTTPVLLSLSLAGTISLPTQAIFFAAAACLIAKSGITTICNDN